MDQADIAQIAGELNAIGLAMLLVDGDRDHMNKSDLTCEMTQTIAERLKCISRNLGYQEQAS